MEDIKLARQKRNEMVAAALATEQAAETVEATEEATEQPEAVEEVVETVEIEEAEQPEDEAKAES